MKKYLLLILLSGLITSCGKLPENGKLDGQWRLMSIASKDNVADPAYLPQSIKNPPVYWSIQLKLLSIQAPGNFNTKTEETFARFVYDKDKFEITEYYVHYRNHDDLVTAEQVDVINAMKDVGVRGISTKYRIVKLTHKDMILCSDLDSLVFRKMI